MMENDQQFASSLTRGKGCSADSGYLDSAASKEPANTSSSSTNEINAVNSSEQACSSSSRSEDIYGNGQRKSSIFDASKFPPGSPIQVDDMRQWKYPYEFKWTEPRKATIDSGFLKWIHCNNVMHQGSNEIYTIVEHIELEQEHVNSLSFLQPGFVIVSVDGKPLHKLDESPMFCRQRSATFNLGDLRPGITGFVDLFYMEPMDVEAIDKKTFLDNDSKFHDDSDVESAWEQIADNNLSYIPFCYITLLSTSPYFENNVTIQGREQNMNKWLLSQLFAEDAESTAAIVEEVTSGKFYANFLESQDGCINRSVVDKFSLDLYQRARAALLAESMLRRGMTIRDVAGVQSRHIPVKLVQHLMHKQVRRSVDVFVNETCQKSQKFVQLFSAFYSLIVITVNTDNFKESNLQIVHEYLSKLQHFSGKFEKLPIYFVLFTASPEDGNMLGSNQHKGKVHDVQTKLRLLLKTVGKQNYVEFFTINLGSNLCSGVAKFKNKLSRDIVEQEFWCQSECLDIRGEKWNRKGGSEGSFPKYPLKFLACRDLIVSKAQTEFEKKRPFCIPFEQFNDFIIRRSEIDQTQITEALHYFENSGFILTVNLAGSQNLKDRSSCPIWVLMYPHLVFISLCTMMKNLSKVAERERSNSLLGSYDEKSIMAYKKLGVVDRRLWNEFLVSLEVALGSPQILEFLGICHFSPPSQHLERVLLMSQMRIINVTEKNSARKCWCSKKVASGVDRDLSLKSNFIVRFYVASGKPLNPWILYQINQALIMECLPYYSLNYSCFEYNCGMSNQGRTSKSSSRMASLLSLNGEASLNYGMKVNPLGCQILISTAVKSSKLSPASSIRHLLAGFQGFLVLTIGKVLEESKFVLNAVQPSTDSRDSRVQFEVSQTCSCCESDMMPLVTPQPAIVPPNVMNAL